MAGQSSQGALVLKIVDSGRALCTRLRNVLPQNGDFNVFTNQQSVIPLLVIATSVFGYVSSFYAPDLFVLPFAQIGSSLYGPVKSIDTVFKTIDKALEEGCRETSR